MSSQPTIYINTEFRVVDTSGCIDSDTKEFKQNWLYQSMWVNVNLVPFALVMTLEYARHTEHI